MTPFGKKLRDWRQRKNIKQREMAAALRVSQAYLSALEHGRRGTPPVMLIHQICQYLGLIWDDADELHALARDSRPKLRLNMAGLTPEQTRLANRLLRELRHMPAERVAAFQQLLDEVEDS